jgi:hypothetical protein
MKKGSLLLVLILVAGAQIATLRLLPKYFPLEKSRLEKFLSSTKPEDLVGLRIMIFQGTPIPLPYSVARTATAPPITPYAREITIYFSGGRASNGVWHKELSAGIGFYEGQAVVIPPDYALAIVKDLIAELLGSNINLSKDYCPTRNVKVKEEFLRIQIQYWRDPAKPTYMPEIEAGYYCSSSPFPANVEKFLKLFNKRVVDFTLLALKEFPPKDKSYTELTENQVKEIEKKLGEVKKETG